MEVRGEKNFASVQKDELDNGVMQYSVVPHDADLTPMSFLLHPDGKIQTLDANGDEYLTATEIEQHGAFVPVHDSLKDSSYTNPVEEGFTNEGYMDTPAWEGSQKFLDPDEGVAVIFDRDQHGHINVQFRDYDPATGVVSIETAIPAIGAGYNTERSFDAENSEITGQSSHTIAVPKDILGM